MSGMNVMIRCKDILHIKRGERKEIRVVSGYQQAGGIPDFQCFLDSILEGRACINCF